MRQGTVSRQAARRAGEEPETRDDGIAFGGLQPSQRLAYPLGVEQRMEPAEPHPRLGEPELDPTAVERVPVTGHQTEPRELAELERGGGDGDAQPRGQIAHGDRGRRVEMLENAGLVIRHPPAAGRVAELATSAGGMDGRIGGEDRVDGIIEHRLKIRQKFDLSNQTNRETPVLLPPSGQGDSLLLRRAFPGPHP